MIFKGLFAGDPREKTRRAYESLVQKVNAHESALQALSAEALRGKTAEFRERLKNGATLDNLLPEAFAVVREVARRVLGQRHYDVQLIGGAILHEGKIAEMRTGEGKTLAATLPVYLNALLGFGVHVVTVNEYLARRDAVWMGQIYDFLGMSVGCLNSGVSYLYDSQHTEAQNPKPQIPNPKQTPNSKFKIPNSDALDKARDTLGAFKVVHEFLKPCEKRDAYAADITYGTINEYVFDYLRDNIAYEKEHLAQRGWQYAIVDEIDSILIDEARTPLIISAQAEDAEELYHTFARIARGLEEGADYTVDEKLRAISLTDAGITKAEQALGVENIYTEKGIKYVHHLENAVRAKAIFHRDKAYVVKPARPDARLNDAVGQDSGRSGGDGEVIIVD